MYDVVVVGAGIVGSSIFREFTKYNLKVLMIDKENDVSMGASRANSAIVHAGYDPIKGTLMAKYNVLGNKMFEGLCKELSVPFKRNGSLIIGFNDEDKKMIEKLYENGVSNNVEDLEIIDGKKVLELEANISKDVKCALYAKTGGIVGAYEFTIALAENGVSNGGEIKLNSELIAIEKNNDEFSLKLSNGEIIKTRYVVNAAGVYSDKVHDMICSHKFEIEARKGSYFVLDKSEGSLFKSTIFQCPGKMGKGVLVTPSVHGNLLVGPDAVTHLDKEDLSTNADSLDFIKESSRRTSSSMDFRENVRNFSGLRAVIKNYNDFIVEESEVKGFIDVAGIKSPGLTSAPAIALDVVEIIKNSGLNLEKKNDFINKREQIHFMELSTDEKREVIKKNPLYGRVICRCENITEGEIIDSIKRPVGAKTLDGVKRRVRPGCGRCQGGFCGPRVQEIIARELNKNIEEVYLDKEGSYILTGKTKGNIEYSLENLNIK